MEIHVARDGAALGVFSPDEVRAGLAEGRFRGSDLAWRAGMSTWTALAEWPEFGSVTSFAKVAEPGATSIEWETRPSFGSLLRGIGMMVVRPAELAVAKLGFGRSLGGAYLALLVGLIPFVGLVILNSHLEARQMEVLAEAAESVNPAFAAGMREALAESQDRSGEPGPGIMLCGATCVLTLLPLFAALAGLLQWPLYRLLGAKASVERVVSGDMLAFAWLFVGLLPVSLLISLLGLASPGASLLLNLLFQLVFLLLHARAMGHAVGCGFWRALGVKLLLFTVFCACCCCISLLIGFAGASAAA